MKTKTTQIGGKGTRRVKRKTRRQTFNIDAKYLLKIDRLNTSTQHLNTAERENLSYLIRKCIKEFSKQFSRSDISNRKDLKPSMLTPSFWTEQLLENDTSPIRLRKTAIEYITLNFKPSVKKEYFNLLNAVSKMVSSQDFQVNADSHAYDRRLFEASLNFFNISAEHQVTFTNIREQYDLRKSQATTEEEHKRIASNFKLLRNQYDEYLKSFYR